MKAVFITYNQSMSGRVDAVLDDLVIRGYTMWTGVMGRGSVNGEPHLGSHTWPALNNSILTVLDEDKAERLLSELKMLNEAISEPGLRAFMWQVEGMI